MIKQIFQNITGITYFKAMKEIADERINNLTNIIQRQRDFENLQNKLQEKNAEIRKIEKEFTKEGIIPMQIAFENGCDCEMVYLDRKSVV